MKKVFLIWFLLASQLGLAKSFYLNESRIDYLFSVSNLSHAKKESIVNTFVDKSNANEKYIAGSLAILCGTCGLHRFYLHHYAAGAVLAGTSLIGVGIIIGSFALNAAGIVNPLLTCVGYIPLLATSTISLIDGVVYIMGNHFEQDYKNNPKILQWVN